MCNGSKKCKKCTSIKIGSTMAKKKARRRRRRIGSTAAKFSMIDVAAGVAGGVVGLGANKIINQFVDKQPDKTRAILGKAVPAAKIAIGGYLATQKKMKRNVRFFGAGLATAGGIELAVQVAPEYVGIAGTGDLYQQIGSADPLLRLAYDPAVEGTYSSYPAMHGDMMMEDSLVVQ